MKSNKLKGFTLIELIVVMAIFMVVMAAAMSLMEPVSKKVMLADVRESGAAQVNSISKYLQGELGSAEYLTVTNDYVLTVDPSGEITDDSDIRNKVNNYVQRYYEGVLKKGSAIPPSGTLSYGTGKVHVIAIDNNQGGKISELIYDVKFDIGNNFITSSKPVFKEYAINKAYYTDTKYVINLGKNGSQLLDGSATDVATFVNSLSAADTTFTIEATITRGTANPKTYTFTTTATASMANIMERHGCVSGKYYVVNQDVDTNTHAITSSIVDITTSNLSSSSTDPSLTLSRKFGSLENVSSINCIPVTGQPTSGSTSKYLLIYSYGNEMKTS